MKQGLHPSDIAKFFSCRLNVLTLSGKTYYINDNLEILTFSPVIMHVHAL